MKFLAILAIGVGVGMLGGLLILWFNRRPTTSKAPNEEDSDATADSRC